MKKIVSLLLVVAVMFSMFSFNLNTSAASGIQSKLDTVKAVYPTGSYFTVSGNAAQCDGSCSQCYLPSIPARGGLPSGASVGWGAWSCCGFAAYVYYCVFGHNHNSNTVTTSAPVFGDLVKATYKAWGSDHWFIYLSEDSNNYYVYDANGTSPTNNKVIYNHALSKSSFDLKIIYHATNYDAVNAVHNHSYTSSITTQPGCETTGIKTFKCSCGHSYTETVPAAGHKWDNGTVITSAGCENTGLKRYTCNVCQKTKDETLSAEGHTEVIDAAVAATCTATGLTEGSHCSKCNAIIVEQKVTAALGHDYVLKNTDKTCSSVTGYYECSRCGDKHQETSSEAIWSSWSETKPSGIDESMIDTKTQYRSATKEVVKSSASEMDGYIIDNDAKETTYGAWTNVSWTRTKPTESDVIRITDTKTVTDSAAYTEYKYYHWYGWSDGQWYNSYGSGVWKNYESVTSSSAYPAYKVYDGYQSYKQTVSGKTGYIWFLESTTNVPAKTHTEWYYQTRTKNVINTFYRWSEFSDWQDAVLTASENTKVETRTLYRTKITPDSHEFSAVWTFDSTGHWNNCEKCSEKGNFAEHSFTNGKTCSVCGYTKYSETDPLIKVASVRGIIGNQVKVAVSLKNNPGIVSMALKLSYDENVLKLVNVEDCGVLGTQVHSPSLGTPYYLNWVNDTATTNFTANGDIVILTFEVLENAALGKTAITVSYTPDNYEIYDKDGTEVNFAVESGYVDVSDILIGDVNGDGVVNGKDRLLLTRWLANWPEALAEGINEAAADVNCDGKVNGLDRLILTRHLAHWEEYATLPYKK